jgi:hypothetical protein
MPRNFDPKTNISLKEKFSELRERFAINKKKLLIILGAITVLVLGIGVYFGLVPLNFHSGGFRFFIGLLLFIWSLPLILKDKNVVFDKPLYKNPWSIPALLLLGFIVVNVIVSFITSPLFMSRTYRDLISVHDNESFVVSVEDYSTMQIPVVDKGLAQKLGDKKLGEDNYGSQFDVGDYYMICHKNQYGQDNLYWIAPIEFSGFFPWADRKVSPGYIMVNANDQSDVKIIKDELTYTDSAYFWADLNRNNYFHNLTAWRANEPHLELTDDGEPRYVETVLANKIGYENGTDVIGVIVTNPKTGECQYYDYLDAPTWINHVMTEEIIVEQLSYWGKYVNGFFNSIFAKKDVLEVSTGLNYVYSNGNMYLQTGMTSVGSDESIVGVMMIDMRTKEAKFCRIGGATEWAAAQSAIGKDQEKRYSASDPIMINLDGEPTYFLMLKDDEGLVKRYAYVNVRDYRLVATAETKTSALIEYKKLIATPESQQDAEEYTIKEIRQVIVNGNTVYYIRFNATADTPEDFEDRVFSAPLSLSPSLAFVEAGDTLKIKYEENHGVYEISMIE